MKLLTNQNLIDAGYEPGPVFKQLNALISRYEAKGITDPKYALKLLKRDCVKPLPRLRRRVEPIPFSEAISPANAEEEKNVESVRRQMIQLLRTPVISAGVILPDACPVSSQEAEIPVGAAVVAENAIIPSAHSADICCSMFATFYDKRSSIGSELDDLVSVTNFGPIPRAHADTVEDSVTAEDVWDNPFLKGLENRARMHMADQGDGNHFAYIGEMEVTPAFVAVLRLTGHVEFAESLAASVGKILRVVVTHHGSRSIGAHLFKRGQIAAEKHTAKVAEDIPKASAWLDANSDTGADYWHALQYIARWTKANHRAIHRRFLAKIGGSAVAEMGNEHNFVWKRGDHFYHGKGATPAWKDELGRPKLGLIPLNMAEPILLALGADNVDFLSFAPHGAGRNLSRTALMRKFPGEKDRERQLVKSTAGIDVRWFSGVPDLSETPVAYKNAAEVKKQIADFGLAEVIAEIRPLGCVMAGHIDQPWRSRKEMLSPKQLRQIEHRAERRKVKRELDGED